MASALKVVDVSKRFGNLEALKPLSVSFFSGEVHAVVGENGAGKSTLMNILGGFLNPTSGSVSLDERPVPVGNPQKCRAVGIEMVHQHFKLVPAFTIEENLRLSQLGIGQTSIEAIRERANGFGWTIPWGSRVADVPVGVQQRVEILKCVASNPEVMIFDEPTATLSEEEVGELIQFMRALASEGKIVIVIAHKIEEVLAASDRITVLRKGEHIGTVERTQVSADQLIEMMVGELRERQESPTAEADGDSPALVLKEVRVRGDQGVESIRDVSLDIRKGEIVGFGGVDGNGQVELAEALAGVRPLSAGSIRFEGKPLDFTQTFVGYVPQDRHVDGLALDLDLIENIAVSTLANHGAFSRRRQVEKATKLIDDYSIKAKSPHDLAKQLSGGNQQKVILSRVLDQQPRILVVVNPTRGLDVKAAAFVHDQIRGAAKAGACVLVFTTDRDELLDLTHSQYYLSRGKIFADEKEALAS